LIRFFPRSNLARLSEVADDAYVAMASASSYTSRVGHYGARFAGVVYLGETLKASIWKEGDGFQAVVTAPSRDDVVVLSGVELVPA
jgi:acyl dehydratase